MNKNEQQFSKNGSFRARAIASTAHLGPDSYSFIKSESVSSVNQAIGEKGRKSADLSLEMECTSHHHYS